jgi:hypothetical protein
MDFPVRCGLMALLVSIFFAQLASADDVELICSEAEINSVAQEKDLGLLPVVLSGSINAAYLKNNTQEQKVAAVNRYFHQFFPLHTSQLSKFKHSVQCTSSTIQYQRLQFKCGEKTRGFLFPMADSVNIRKMAGLPSVVLVVEIVSLYKSPEEFEKNDVSSSPDEDSDLEPGEECLHWVCKFVFWNKKEKIPLTVGAITAEGCGMSMYRYGEGGAWERSISDLAQQIYEDTPFSMWDKGNYIYQNIKALINIAPAPGTFGQPVNIR